MSSATLLDELLAEELKDLHVVEIEMSRILPTMSAAVDHPVMSRMFQRQTETCHQRIARLADALGKIGRIPRRKPGKAMQGLAKETKTAAGMRGSEAHRDARLLAVALRLSHHKMAAYGNARSLAQSVAQYGISNFLQHALDEEAEIDRELTTLSAIIYQEVYASAAAQSTAPSIPAFRLSHA
jgi:ferritin-like metal-binding protein YciE